MTSMHRLSIYNVIEVIKMNRSILHCDINHCYAQIEEMKHPFLRDVLMVVGGDEEKRHGIVLAKNLLAKPFKIQTGESLREALKKCPQLTVIPADFKEYLYYTNAVKNIYRDYTEQVESFGLDEAWVDITNSLTFFGKTAIDLGREIQQRVLNEYGLTVSIGCSFNKIFAKLGSDMIKPSGLVEITMDNYQQVAWSLPVEDLLYVGRSTSEKCHQLGILTIGDLANTPLQMLRKHFGKMGEVIHLFANGWDQSLVHAVGQHELIKSVGNSVTTPHNINNLFEAKLVLYVLAESIAARLKEQGLQGHTISIRVRNCDLQSFTRQRKYMNATNITEEILSVALKLLSEHYDFEKPLRSLGIAVSGLVVQGSSFQIDLFNDPKQRALNHQFESSNRYYIR